MVAINYESFRFRPTYWLVILLLAVVAYLNVLRIGFLSDDFVLLFQASTAKSPLYAFAFDRTQYFYRPVGQTLAWWLNWQIWGYDPLPFHLVGLLLHAGIATLLGLWLAEVFPKQRIVGWLAGALFAVYPLSAEAVGWLADQWDLWAALFMLLSLYLFTKWWLRPGGNGRILYFLALVCYFAALVSKESVLAFLPIYAIAALLATARRDQTAIRRVALSLVPFGLLLIIYLGLRITALGSIGGYPISSNSPLSGFLGNGWDILFSRFLYLLFAPVNASLVGLATQQSLALLLALAWIVGLCVYARRSASWLILAVAWLVVGFVPALNLSLSIQSSDLQQTRFLYVGSAGYCIGAAAVLYNVVISIRHRLTKRMAIGGIALVLAACIVGSWSNLRSWQAATNYDLAINQRLLNLIPAQPRPRGTAWYIQDLPDNYRGAYLFRLGLGAMQRFTRSLDQTVGTVAIPSDATTEQVEQFLRNDTRDSYRLRFKYDATTDQYNVDDVAGITGDTGIPAADPSSIGLQTWDFRSCSDQVLQAWQVAGAPMHCEAGMGLILNSGDDGAHLLGPATNINLQSNQAWYVRLRASVSYQVDQNPSAAGELGEHNQWYWRYGSEDWNEGQSKSLPASIYAKSHVYWTYLPISAVQDTIDQLRFDPLVGAGQAQVAWIAVDMVR